MSQPHTHADWKLTTTCAQAWEAMLAGCAAARHTIDLEQFIFEDDRIGTRFAEVLQDRVRAGVKVRMICDTAGSYSFYNSTLARALRKAGVHIRFFNQISPWRIRHVRLWLNRDHRKVIVIDSDYETRRAFVGGVGIGDFMSDWRDTNVEVTGDIVMELQRAFNNMWWIVSNERFLRLKEPRQTEDGFSVLTNAPHFRQRHIDRAVIESIRTAEQSIYITTPYFVQDRRFFRVIRLAARRGVDVRIIVPYQSDHPYVDFASQFYFQKALKAGVKLFWYMPTMMHAKTVVIDGEWASVGSANVDNLSSFFNYELNLVSVARGFAEDVETHFFTDLGRSIEVKTTEWQARPLLRKILEMLSAPFGRFF